MNSFDELLPRRLLGGGTIKCDPITYLIHVDMSVQKFRELRADADGAKNLQARFLHEYDHLYRHWSTSYGFVQSGLASRLAFFFADAFGKAPIGNRKDYLFPLLNRQFGGELLHTILEERDCDVGEAAAAVAKAFHKCGLYEQALVLYLGHIGLANALRDSVSLKEFPLVLHTLALLDKRVLQPSSPINLVVWLPGCQLDSFERSAPWMPLILTDFLTGDSRREYVLTATHLLELMAVVHEVGVTEHTRPSKPNWTELVGEEGPKHPWILNDSNDYRLVLDCWEHTFGDVGIDPSAKSSWSALPLELIAAVDLALWIPLTPSGFYGDKGIFSWMDVNPGWRFARILTHLRRTGISHAHPDSLAEGNRLFGEVQDKLCADLGWPNVDALAKMWLKFFEDATGRGGMVGYFGERAQHPRFKVSIEILKARRQKPYEVALDPRWFGSCDGVEEKNRNFPVAGQLFLEEGKRILVGQREVGKGWFCLRKFYLVDGVDFLTLGTGPLSSCNNNVRCQARNFINDWCVHEHEPGWESRRFLEEAGSWLKC